MAGKGQIARAGKRQTQMSQRTPKGTLPVKRPHQGAYCATSGCACAHLMELRRGHVTLGHFQQPWYLYYCTIFFTTTIVRKKRVWSRACAEHTTGHFWLGSRPARAASGHVTSGHDTSGSSTSALHHRKCDFVTTYILLTQL